MKRSIKACMWALAAGLMFSAYGEMVTVQQNNFDGDNGNDIGPGFKITSINSPQDTDLMDASTGVISFSAPSGSRPNVTLVSDTSVDVSSYAGFTVTWNVDSIVSSDFSIEKNGLFLGVQADGSGAWNNVTSLGVAIKSSAGPGDVDLVYADGSVKSSEATLVGAGGLTDASIIDGFTAVLTVNDDNTWSVSTSGLSTDVNTNGTLSNVTYSQLAGTLFASTALQLNKSQPLHTITCDSMSVSAVFDPSAPATLLLSPSDQLDITLDAPASQATGTVDVAFTYGGASNNVQITEVNVVDQQHAVAFSAVDFSSPLVLTEPASNETLNIQFDLAGTGLADGETSTGLVELVWNEVGGDTFTNTLPVSATYNAPAAELVLPGSLDMVFEAPASSVTDDLAVSYSADTIDPVDIEITAVDFADASHSGFSCSTVPPTLTLSESAPASALSIAFDNGVAGLNEGETATATAQVIWNEAGHAVNQTNTVAVSAFHYKEVEDGTLLYNNFDGVSGNDIGPGFKTVSINEPQETGLTDASTGVISFSSADKRPNVTLISDAAMDLSSYSGFTVTWNVDSIVSTNLSISKNGLFLGVQDNDSDPWNKVSSLGVAIKSDAGVGDLDLVWGKGGDKGLESALLTTNVLTDASITNGFSATLTVSNNNTWSVSTTGFNTNITASGTLVNVTYGELAGTFFASTAFQLNTEKPLHTITCGSVSVIAVPGPPAPSRLVLSPSDQLEITIETPATLATGAVDVAFSYGGNSNNVQITSATVIDQQHAGSFSVVDFSSPLVLADPASSEPLNVQFDLTGSGLADGATSTGMVKLVWNEIGGDTFTNMLPVSVTYLGPESFVYMLLGGFDENTGAVKQDERAIGNAAVTLSGYGSGSSSGASDGLWGLSNLGSPDADTIGGAIRGTVNPNLTLVISNTSADENLTLDAIHFQGSRGSSTAVKVSTLSYTAGDLTDAFGDLGTDGAGGYQSFRGYEFDLKTLLSDLTLAPSETATFTLTFTGNTGSAYTQVDNVAISGLVGDAPATPAVLQIGMGVGAGLSVSGSNMTASATYILQGTESLVITNWYDIAVTSGVTEVSWEHTPTNNVEFLRVVAP
ncbi:hypothetical protein [Pontiella sulfatireligans]|uniref:Uncharacterized protein n=1 Tax=Pontiella sulfatireligans TaxID=2750658 RepID=A0A6C2UF90_9BACT|nr:hypothetical protein [Pontiella sulfatireligans]VGO18840.1 hypothetical protein SCARR_00893 [Pontiella sulfatireligans]